MLVATSVVKPQLTTYFNHLIKNSGSSGVKKIAEVTLEMILLTGIAEKHYSSVIITNR